VAKPGTLCPPEAGEFVGRTAGYGEGFEGRRIERVELIGAPNLGPQLRQEIVLAPGDSLTRKAIDQQLRRLWRPGLIDEASARVTDADATTGADGPSGPGVIVELVVHERGLIRGVDIETRGQVPAPKLRRLRSLAGAIDDPGRTLRTARRLEDDLRNTGHWKAEVITRRRHTADGGVRLCVGVDAGPRYKLASVEFPGAKAISAAKLARLVTENRGAINARGGAYRADLLDTDLLRIQAEYYDIGHVMVKVGEPVATIDDEHATIRLSIPIVEGDRFTIGTIKLTGIDASLEASYLALLGVRPGAVFSRSALATGMENIREAERRAGRGGNLTPLTEIDAPAHRIALTLEVTP